MTEVRNAADPDQVKKAGRKDRQKQREEESLIRWLMSQPQGRSFMYRLLQECSVFALSFTGDNNQTNFNEGKRNVGLKQMSLIDRFCPESYPVMMKENTSDRASDSTHESQPAAPGGDGSA